MKTVYIITYPVPTNIKKLIDFNTSIFLIVVDQAMDYIGDLKKDIHCWIGDFDSTKTKDFSNELITLPTEKDITDTEAAVLYAKRLNPSKIVILGGIGGKRFEHALSNIILLSKYDDLEIITDDSSMKVLEEGIHQVDFKGYVNIFSVESSRVSLKGFKYPLQNYRMKINDNIGISNELVERIGFIEVIEGKVLLILTKEQ